MPLKTIYKNEVCEWIDVEKPNSEDIQLLNSQYGIDTLLLDDTKEPNHLPKFEEQQNVKFF